MIGEPAEADVGEWATDIGEDLDDATRRRGPAHAVVERMGNG